MVLIHSMDSDKELQVQTYEEIDAYAVSTTDVRSGIKMTCAPYTWGNNCFLREIPTLQHYSEIVSDIPSGMYLAFSFWHFWLRPPHGTWHSFCHMFWHYFWHSVWHISWDSRDIPSGIHSDMVCGTYSDIPCGPSAWYIFKDSFWSRSGGDSNGPGLAVPSRITSFKLRARPRWCRWPRRSW